ncbi:HMG-box domain-containing protein [Aureispira anguillae]|uniref:Uncharacterized protein n=1 Tax=Aureispira anguillae TaxID=2864201 RepID=A0A915YK30_9BACT|nr:hypothetical protein [Aureispira anguillae]BDS14669.1 hypothetical protein AsAng_0054500 [Aureispira anguillae]
MKSWDIDIALHELLVHRAEQLYQTKAYKKAAELIAEIAAFEASNYIGYLSSIRLEELLVKIAAELFPIANYKRKETAQRKVLHIGTRFYNIGGHTQVALSWMKNDLNSESHLLLLDQDRALDLTINGTLYQLEEKEPWAKAQALRRFLEEHYFDVIVLHQHMDDIVPTLALWDLKQKGDSLVLFYNHANFRFSLGNIIAHKRINICEGDVVISEKYRYPMDDQILYFILGETMPKQLSIQEKLAYKKQLGIGQTQKIFFTIGAAYKYTPFETVNFLKEWNTFLLEHEACTLIMVGCGQEDFDKFCPNTQKAPNLLLKGHVKNPLMYYQITDYIVDIYPLQTGLGTLNGLYHGVPPILPYQETVMVLGNEMNKLYPRAIENYLSYSTKEGYFKFIKEEIATGAYKSWASKVIEQHIQSKFLLKPWQKQLEELYKTPVVTGIDVDASNDVLNTSKPSQSWYKFTASPDRSIQLIALGFRYNIPLSFNLLRLYFNLIAKQKKLTGAGLKVFSNYLLGKYK